MYRKYTNVILMLKSGDREIAKALLRKFYRNNVWGRHHWREDTLSKGFPGHLRGRVKRVAEDLRKKKFLVKRPSSHGYQWYANIKKLKEIEDFIKD